MSKKPHLSVHREIEGIKEEVARNAIIACAEWLRERGHEDLGQALLEDKLEALPDDAHPDA